MTIPRPWQAQPIGAPCEPKAEKSDKLPGMESTQLPEAEAPSVPGIAEPIAEDQAPSVPSVLETLPPEIQELLTVLSPHEVILLDTPEHTIVAVFHPFRLKAFRQIIKAGLRFDPPTRYAVWTKNKVNDVAVPWEVEILRHRDAEALAKRPNWFAVAKP